ncbi:ATP-binding protein [Calderihabitans maritimus]|uniref:Novel STAND NTPase 1 domain-containing protein n=1 Tax=Calderihabitans maritimus TaxID=1246530 RepID=A0A1Z5HYE4_9FIRM|nr:ATP-binding protein [Calderihabitans maritimus]GAW94377.1 hypothetical protein KKC1_34830 [Calderihabitans maritimus]
MNDIYQKRLPILNSVFTPASPIEDQRIFAGRSEQINAIIELAYERGMQGVIYGERGVGKTSLANIVNLILSNAGLLTAKVSCDSTDNYTSLWKKVLSNLSIDYSVTEKYIGFTSSETTTNKKIPVSLFIEEETISPGNVVTALKLIYEQLNSSILIILDEFDRLGSDFNRLVFADTLKNIADNFPKIHILIVGVAETITELIGEHASIERNIKQIYLPSMSSEEIAEIISNGLKHLEMTMDEKVIKKIIEFSSGYPHYTHLLCLNSCKTALRNGSSHVSLSDFDNAIRISVKEIHESLRSSYQKATLATKPNIYKEVLWACALAETDEHGTFQAVDLEEPLSKILGRDVKVNHFTYHLGKFTSEERGEILTTVSVGNRTRYKFKNPLMKAFVKLNMYLFSPLTDLDKES